MRRGFWLTEGTNLCELFFSVQSELENVNSLLTQAEGKNIKSSKDCSSLESQLQDSQVQKKIFACFKSNWFICLLVFS